MSVIEPHHSKIPPSGANVELSTSRLSRTTMDSIWTPYLSYLNLIFDCVDEAGANGVSSMVIRSVLYSYVCLTYYRPLEINRLVLSVKSLLMSSFLG